MIRDKNKIYAEPNDPNTVVSVDNLAIEPNEYYIVGHGNKGIKHHTAPPRSILITDANGNLTSLSYSNKPNTFIGTDGAGNIVLLDRSLLL